MDLIEVYEDNIDNFSVLERNRTYLNFVDNYNNSDTEEINIHSSNLGDHLITYEISDNDNTDGNSNLLHDESNTIDIYSGVESEEENDTDEYMQNEEENEIEHYLQDYNDNSGKRLNEVFKDFYDYCNGNK